MKHAVIHSAARRKILTGTTRMKVLGLLFVLAELTLAQPVSLTGPWKLQIDDNAQWAQPGIDDSNWPIVTLPDRSSRNDNNYWLRRTIAAPHCDGECYGTFGLFADSYEVYANGVFIGGTEDFASSELHYPQPRAFRIPRGRCQIDNSVDQFSRLDVEPGWRYDRSESA